MKEQFCEQIRQCEKAMYALAWSVLRSDQDAADAIGEAIVRAYSHLDQLKKKDAFKPWILKILHNTCLEMLRSRRPTVDIDQQYDLEAPERHDVSTRLALRQAVEALEQPYRTVVILFYYEDLPVAEIAGITGASAAAVKKQLSRAREMLRSSLQKEDFDR